MQALWDSLISYISLIVKNFEEEIQLFDNRLDISRGWTFEQLQELLQSNHVSIFFSYILDDRLINSWCLGVLNI